MIQSNNVADRAVITDSARVDTELRSMLVRAAGIGSPTVDEQALLRLLQQAWSGILQASLNGHLSIPEAEADPRLSCQALLAPLTRQDRQGERAQSERH